MARAADLRRRRLELRVVHLGDRRRDDRGADRRAAVDDERTWPPAERSPGAEPQTSSVVVAAVPAGPARRPGVLVSRGRPAEHRDQRCGRAGLRSLGQRPPRHRHEQHAIGRSTTTDPDGRRDHALRRLERCLLVGSPPSLAAGVTVFIAYRLRQHVNGGGIIAAGKAGTGLGQYAVLRVRLSASPPTAPPSSGKTAQADRITHRPAGRPAPTRTTPSSRSPSASAELRDFPRQRDRRLTARSAFGTPDIIVIGARAFNQFAVDAIRLHRRLRGRRLHATAERAELDQLEDYLKSRHQIIWSPGYLDGSLAWWHDDWSRSR